MKNCIICNHELPTVYSSISGEPVCCSDCHNECMKFAKQQRRKRMYNYIAFAIIAILLTVVMMCNHSFAQTDTVSKPTYELQTRVIRWELKTQWFLSIDTYTERAWNAYLIWVPVYESKWVEVR